MGSSAVAASATNGLAGKRVLVRLTVRTETPCIRLLRSLPFRPALGCGYESAAPVGHGLSI